MRTRKDIVLTRIYNEIAIKHKVSSQEVEDIYYQLFKFIKTTVENLKTKKAKTLEDLDEVKCNFNLPRFAKFYMNKNQVLKYNNRRKKDE